MFILKNMLQRPLIFNTNIYPYFLKSNSNIGVLNLHTTSAVNASNKTTAAAGGVMGLGKGKGKKGKLEAMEKQLMPVETDTTKLVTYVCGSNILINGEDVKLKDDSEYPDWLWTLNTGAAPRIEDLDPNTKQYWIRVRAIGMKRNNMLKKFHKF